jgi:hypothetical protein
MTQIQETSPFKTIEVVIPMVELYWTNKHGKECKAYFPEEKAAKFLQKHLIPLKELKMITNVGIREIN